MIQKTFYDEEDYKVVLDLLYEYRGLNKDIERVFTRQMFLRSLEK